MKIVVPEFARFVLAGALNTVTTYLVYLMGLFLLPYLFAYTFSYVTGLLVSYLLNSRFVFRRRVIGVAGKGRFILIYALQYIVNSGLLWLLVERFGFQPEIAMLIVIVLSVPMTYLALRSAFARQSK